MPLTEQKLFEVVDKVSLAIERLRHFEPKDGYYLAFSGGKDSVVIKALADMAGVKYDAHYNNTTIDPPDLVKFIREYHSNVEMVWPKKTFFQLMRDKKFPPSRHIRYCCELLKEAAGSGRIIMTGVRWAESIRRSKRRMTERCYKDKSKVYLNPIIDYTNDEIWEFIRKYDLPYCKLYDEGWERIGCLMCPMASEVARRREAAKYPKMANAFKQCFADIIKIREEVGKKNIFNTADETFEYYMKGKIVGRVKDHEIIMASMFE